MGGSSRAQPPSTGSEHGFRARSASKSTPCSRCVLTFRSPPRASLFEVRQRRVQPDGFAEIRLGPVVIALLPVSHAAVVIGDGALGIQPNGLGAVGDGPINLALAEM